MNKILIIDNEELIIAGLQVVLKQQPEISVTAFRVGELEEQLKESFYSIIFINPGTSIGINLGQRHIITYLKEVSPHSKIIVLVRALDDDFISDTIQLPIDGLLLKCCKAKEIVKAVNAAQRGQKFFCSSVFERILMEKMRPRSTPKELTDRELEIIAHLCKGKTTLEIADTLSRSSHTINTHRKNILKKLKLKNTSELILYAIEHKIIHHGA